MNTRVVFHADDFGMNESVNRGIVKCFREGLLTSTSLLANAPFAESACAAWKSLMAEFRSEAIPSFEIRRRFFDPEVPFDLGVHLNLTQGKPLTGDAYPRELTDEEGNFPGIGVLFLRAKRLNSERLGRVKNELRAQIEWMCDHSLAPVHCNGHQYIEIIPQIADMVPELMQRHSIGVTRVACEPGLGRSVLMRGEVTNWLIGHVKRYHAKRFRRDIKRRQIEFPDAYFGTCHAGRVSLPIVRRYLQQAQAYRFVEIGLHPSDESYPSHVREESWSDPLIRTRIQESNWLCGTEIQEVFAAHQLRLGRLQGPC